MEKQFFADIMCHNFENYRRTQPFLKTQKPTSTLQSRPILDSQGSESLQKTEILYVDFDSLNLSLRT